MSSEDEEQPQTDSSTTGYEAAEKEGQPIENEQQRQQDAEESEEAPQQPSARRQRGRRARRRIGGAATTGRQMTLPDMGKRLDKQQKLIETIGDDVKNLKKLFNQVQKDLSKLQKQLDKATSKARTTTTAARGKRRGRKRSAMTS